MGPAAVAFGDAARTIEVASVEGTVALLSLRRPVRPVPLVPKAADARAARLAQLAKASRSPGPAKASEGRAAEGSVVRGPTARTADGAFRVGPGAASAARPAAATLGLARGGLRTALAPGVAAVAPLVSVGVLPHVVEVARRRPSDVRRPGTGALVTTSVAAPLEARLGVARPVRSVH